MQKQDSNESYYIERKFLGKISTEEVVRRIIKARLESSIKSAKEREKAEWKQKSASEEKDI